MGRYARVRSWALPIAGGLLVTTLGCSIDKLLTKPGVAEGAKPRLAFTTQPQSNLPNVALSPPIQVAVLDSGGNVVTSYGGSVTVSLADNPAGSGLTGTRTVTAAAGVAVFSDLAVDRAGAGYTLMAAADGLDSTRSAPFDIADSVIVRLVVISGDGQQDSVGATLSTAYVVETVDGTGNPVAGQTILWTASEGSITPSRSITDATGRTSAVRTLGLALGPETAIATLDGPAPSAVTFTATTTAAAAVRLAFVVQPTDAAVGKAIDPPVTVAVRDSHDNLVTSFGGTVTVALSENQIGATLAGTLSQPVTDGQAVFTDLSVDKSGTGYAMVARAPGLTDATSTTFSITGASATSSLESRGGDGQTDTVAAVLENAFVVRAVNGAGKPVAGVEIAWTVTMGGGRLVQTSGPTDRQGEARATLMLGTTTGKNAVTATGNGVTGSPSFTATANPGSPATLTFHQQPTNVAAFASIKPAVEVAVEDNFGNVVPNFTSQITMRIAPGTGTPLATLRGDRTKRPTDGIATFPDLSIDLLGVGYRLRASAGLGSRDSNPFTVLP